jgi:hypothetical protein
VCWEQQEGQRFDLWAARYRLDGSWAEPELLESEATDDARSAQVGIDGAGNAFAAWKQWQAGNKPELWQTRQIAGGSWEAPERPGGGLREVLAFELRVDAAGGGAALLSLERTMGTEGPWTVWGKHYVRDWGWRPIQAIFVLEMNQPTSPRLALEAPGAAFAVWGHLANNVHELLFSRGDSNAWSEPDIVPGMSGGGAAQVAADRAGHAFVAAIRADKLVLSRFDPAMGWGDVREFGTGAIYDFTLIPTVEPISFEVAANAQGDAFAIWEDRGGSEIGDVWAVRYDASTDSWDEPVKLDTENTGSANQPKVRVDASGNAIAVWQQYDGVRSNIWFNRYVPELGWTGAGQLEMDDVGDAEAPQIALDGQGRALVVWHQYDGSQRNIMANRLE